MARRPTAPPTGPSKAALGLAHQGADLTHPDVLRFAASRIATKLLATAAKMADLAEEGLASGELSPADASKLLMAAANATRAGVSAARDAAVLAAKLGGVIDAQPVEDALPEDPLKALPENEL